MIWETLAGVLFWVSSVGAGVALVVFGNWLDKLDLDRRDREDRE